MGKTVLNQSDVEKLFEVVLNSGAYIDTDYKVFEEIVQEVFAIYDDTEKENE